MKAAFPYKPELEGYYCHRCLCAGYTRKLGHLAAVLVSHSDGCPTRPGFSALTRLLRDHCEALNGHIASGSAQKRRSDAHAINLGQIGVAGGVYRLI